MACPNATAQSGLEPEFDFLPQTLEQDMAWEPTTAESHHLVILAVMSASNLSHLCTGGRTETAISSGQRPQGVLAQLTERGDTSKRINSVVGLGGRA